MWVKVRFFLVQGECVILWGMETYPPISSDSEAQAQWEAVIKAFHADVVRRTQAAQARFEGALRESLRVAMAKAQALRP